MHKAAQVKAKFGKVVKEIRLDKGLTQEKLAEMAEVDRTYIYRIETGKRSPSLEVLFRIASALQLTPGELLDRIKR